MKIQLRIVEWESKGLRCPDHHLKFYDDASPYNVSLIQMPNGTGKTTTLQLLRAALSGEANNWDSKTIESFKKRDKAVSCGNFRVGLNYNGKKITINMEFNFENNTVLYTTTTLTGIKKGFKPPSEISRFLTHDFVNFFVFDGELAERLLSTAYTNAQNAIEVLFQLKIFRDMKQRLEEYWHEIAKGPTEQTGLSRRRNRVGELTKRLKQLENERDNKKCQLEDAKRELEMLKGKFYKELEKEKKQAKEIAEVENELNDSENKIKEYARKLLVEMRNPQSLSSKWASDLIDFKLSLDRLKLPQSAAKEFFEELAGSEECVCGRHIDEKSRQMIRERASNYFGAEDVAFLNSLKSDISELIDKDNEWNEKKVKESISILNEEIERSGEIRRKRDFLVEIATENDPKLKIVQEKINVLQEKIGSLNNELEKYEDPSDTLGDKSTGIEVLKKRLVQAEKELAEVTDTIELNKKRKILSAIFDNALNIARRNLSIKICEESNKKITTLMPDNNIRIDRIDKCLKLKGQEGGSVGEQLSIAYAFLATLFNNSEYDFPFIVDSPANPIDLKVRAKVAELIPKISNQFIAFTISSERQRFLEPLQKHSKNIHFVTMFRKGNSKLERTAKEYANHDETSDGLIVYDYEFFCGFQLDKES